MAEDGSDQDGELSERDLVVFQAADSDIKTPTRRLITQIASAYPRESDLDGLQAIDDPTAPDPLGFDRAVIEWVEYSLYYTMRQPETEALNRLQDCWEKLDEQDRRLWTVEVLKRARNGSNRSIARRMNKYPQLAEELGWSDGGPHHSTLSRNIEIPDDVSPLLDEAAQGARFIGLQRGGPVPDAVANELDPNEANIKQVPFEEKMAVSQEILGTILPEIFEHVSFDRDPKAPNYRVPTSSIYALFAHLALERSYAETGTRTLRWMDLQPAVPEPGTLYKYIRNYSVTQIDEKFAGATETVLDAVSVPDELHLAYDITNVRWYGDDTTLWTSGTLPKDNTSQAWQFAVLTSLHPDARYVLGALPLRTKKHLSGYLRRFLRRVVGRYDLSIGRIYMDSQMQQKRVVTACRSVGADYLIHAEDDGDFEDLLDEADPGEPEEEPNIDFSDFAEPRKPNGFAYPISPEQVGGRNQDRDHTAFMTDMDVEERDLRGLAHQFRYRWGIETAIRQLKNRLHGLTQADDERIRAWYFSTACLYYNLLTYTDNKLADTLGPESGVITGEELLHVLRDTDWTARL